MHLSRALLSYGLRAPTTQNFPLQGSRYVRGNLSDCRTFFGHCFSGVFVIIAPLLFPSLCSGLPPPGGELFEPAHGQDVGA